MTKKELEGKILEITKGENLVSGRTLKKIDELPYIELEHCGMSGTGKGMLWVACYVGDGEQDEICELIEVQNLEWKELALENEDKIKEAMREAFKDSIGDVKDSWGYAVALDEDGNVTTYFLSQNSTPTSVWEGNAIVVASWERDTLDELTWELESYLNPLQLADFELWLEDDDNYDKTLEDWDPELYEDVKEKRHKDFLDTYTDYTVNNAWDNFISDMGRE